MKSCNVENSRRVPPPTFQTNCDEGTVEDCRREYLAQLFNSVHPICHYPGCRRALFRIRGLHHTERNPYAQHPCGSVLKRADASVPTLTKMTRSAAEGQPPALSMTCSISAAQATPASVLAAIACRTDSFASLASLSSSELNFGSPSSRRLL